MSRRPRTGFALLAVLWLMTGIAALGLALSLAARGAVATARNRMEMTRAGWRAEDCIERVRAVVAATLGPEGTASTASTASTARPPALDAIVASSPLVEGCPGRVAFAPVGLAVDLTETTDDAVRRLLLWQGMTAERTDSLTDALLDWRDPDDTPRPHGAEGEWYERHGRSPPRNGRLAHIDELRRVRGFETWSSGVDSSLDPPGTLFTVHPGRVVLERAPAAVLASLPGMTEETIARLVERGLRGAPPLRDVLALGEELSIAARDSLYRHGDELVRRATLDPDAWTLVVYASGSDGERSGTDPVAIINVRLVLTGTRAAIVRRWSGS